jgi:energy-coupling factor transport system substrate-specific component
VTRPIPAPVTGALPRAVAALTIALALAWVGWPVWASGSAPDRAALAAEVPWVLGALASLLVLLGFTLWLAAGRSFAPFAPASLLGAAAVLTPHYLHPGAGGVELLYVFPLVAGVVLGAPAGLLTGASAALISAVAGGTVGTPLPAQALVWGLWGVAGALLRPLGTVAAWLWAAVLCVPLGPLSGLLLNLTGWPGEQSDAGAFLPGLPPWESARRLVEYTWTTSFAYDLTRGVTCAVAMALIGLPLLAALRRSHDPRSLPVAAGAQPVAVVSARSLDRRARSRRLENLWTNQGDPDD